MRPKNKALFIVRAAAIIGVLAPAFAAFAQEYGPSESFEEPRVWIAGAIRFVLGVMSTCVFGLVGILLLAIGYRVFARVLPFSVKKELEEDHNVSVGIVIAAALLGIGIIVAATILS